MFFQLAVNHVLRGLVLFDFVIYIHKPYIVSCLARDSFPEG